MKAELLIGIIVICLLVVFVIGFIVVRDIRDDVILMNNRMSEIESHLKPHERLKNVEKFTRNFCLDGRIKACALLGPIEK